MPHLTGVSGQVFYQSWQPADARAGIVFLHGFGEHSGLYDRLAAALGERAISLWAIDEIGHGRSDGERGDVDSLDALEANARRLTELAGGEAPGLPLVLAGHSLGAAAAALLVARDPTPFHGAVLSGAPLRRPEWIGEAQLGGPLQLDAADLSADPFYLGRLADDPLVFTESDASPLGALPPAWDELERTFADVRVPVLLVHGELDPVAPIAANRALAREIEAVRLAEIAGSHHDVLNDTEHARVAAEIADFTLSVTGAG